MGYQIEHELKARARTARMTLRDLAAVLDEPPSTTAGRLNGFSPLLNHQRRALIRAIEAAELTAQEEG